MTPEAQALLMSALTSGSSRSALLQQALQQTDLDPAVGELLTRYISEREEPGDDDEETDEEILERDRRIEDLSATLEDVSDKFSRLYAEVETLREERASYEASLELVTGQLATLAAALGVCPECIGQAQDCPSCGGEGFPGSAAYRPDPALYRQYVVPAVEARRRIHAANPRIN